MISFFLTIEHVGATYHSASASANTTVRPKYPMLSMVSLQHEYAGVSTDNPSIQRGVPALCRMDAPILPYRKKKK